MSFSLKSRNDPGTMMVLPRNLNAARLNEIGDAQFCFWIPVFQDAGAKISLRQLLSFRLRRLCTQVIGAPVPSSFILWPVTGLYFMNLPVLQLGDCFHLEQNVFCAIILCQRRLNLFPDVHSFNQCGEFCFQEQLDFLVIN